MSNSLLTGVSGLRAHQQMLDVVGNNLANSNTVGYKAQRIRFGDLISQTLAEATKPASPALSGTNPVQIGLGVKVEAVDVSMQQGNLEATGRDLDLALQGDGYFIARNGSQKLFTRVGAFGVDADNYLVDPASGFRVQRFGTVGEATGTQPGFQAIGSGDVRIPTGGSIPGQGTANVTMQGNLSARAAAPQAQTLTSVQPFLAGGVPATAATLLNVLDDNTTDYVAGDLLNIQGQTRGNTPVSATLAVGPATTIGDLLNAINANFPGSTASLDAAGNLVVQDTATGVSSLSVTLTDATGNTGATTWASHALTVTAAGQVGETVRTGIQVFDSQGTAHNLTLIFQKQASNTWDLTAQLSSAEGTLTDATVTGITFNDDGSFRQVAGTGAGDASLRVQFTGIAAPQTIALNFGTIGGFNGMTQFGGDSSAAAVNQDGFASGYLTGLSFGQDGIINGNFSNGRSMPLAQLAIASFANPEALDRVGDNYYTQSNQSGDAVIGTAKTGGRGSVQQKVLESSNVDVALEFTRLIIAQRGFQVNARTITASDQILQELANLIH